MRIGICDDVKDEQEETKNCLYNNCNLYNYLSNFPYFIGFPACPLVK